MAFHGPARSTLAACAPDLDHLLFLALFLFLPLLSVFTEALRKGLGAYFASFTDPAARSAIWLTLLVAGISVPCNLVFGLAASWAIAKFEFQGKNVLITLIDLPFAVSPVISGLIFVLMFGLQGWFGLWLVAHHVQIIFAVPGIVLATIFRYVSICRTRADPADAGAGHR